VTNLTYVGLDAAYNPNTGVYGLATPASYFIAASGGPTHRFNPGDYINSSVVYNTSVSNATSDINTIIAAGTTGFLGYAMGGTWGRFETSTVSTSPTYNFSDIGTIFNYLQSQWPGARFGLYITGNHYGQSLTQAQMTAANMSNPAGFYVPAYILNCGGSVTVPNAYGSGSTTSYPVGAIYSGATSYGLNFQTIAGSGSSQSFGSISPQWYNPGVNRAFINFLQALSAYQFTVTSGPLSGNTYTLDTCPLVEFVANNDETSYAFISSQNYSSGVTVNPPQSVSGATPSNTNYWIQRAKMYTAWTAAFPHTVCLSCESYSYTTTGFGSDTGENVAANFNSNMPQSARSAPFALDTIIGLALSGPDAYGWDFNASTNAASSAKQGFFGIETPGANNAALPTPTFASRVGVMPYYKQIQPLDYGIEFSGTSYTATAVQQIMATALWATHRIWCMTDDHTSGTPWSGNNAYSTTGIKGCILSNQAASPVTTTKPSNLT
jgi:hypothetical protein